MLSSGNSYFICYSLIVMKIPNMYDKYKYKKKLSSHDYLLTILHRLSLQEINSVIIIMNATWCLIKNEAYVKNTIFWHIQSLVLSLKLWNEQHTYVYICVCEFEENREIRRMKYHRWCTNSATRQTVYV